MTIEQIILVYLLIGVCFSAFSDWILSRREPDNDLGVISLILLGLVWPWFLVFLVTNQKKGEKDGAS